MTPSTTIPPAGCRKCKAAIPRQEAAPDELSCGAEGCYTTRHTWYRCQACKLLSAGSSVRQPWRCECGWANVANMKPTLLDHVVVGAVGVVVLGIGLVLITVLFMWMLGLGGGTECREVESDYSVGYQMCTTEDGYTYEQDYFGF